MRKPNNRAQKLPPCSELIVERGIKEVIIGLLDSSPSMKPGSGIAYLESKGIIVRCYTLYQAQIAWELMHLKP